MISSEFSLVQNKTDYSLTYDSIKLREQKPLYVGNDYQFNFTYTDSDETPINISGYSFRFVGKHKATDSDSLAIFDVLGVIDNASEGKFHFILSNSMVPGPEHLIGYFSILMESSQGSQSVIAQTYAKSGSSSTIVKTHLEQPDGFYNGKRAVFINGSSVEIRTISSYLKSDGKITVAALPFVPSSGDLVIIISSTTPGSNKEIIASGDIEFLQNVV